MPPVADGGDVIITEEWAVVTNNDYDGWKEFGTDKSGALTAFAAYPDDAGARLNKRVSRTVRTKWLKVDL